MLKTSTVTLSSKRHEKGGSKISLVALIAIIVADIFVLGIVSLFLYCYFWRNYRLKEGTASKLSESEKIVYSSSLYPALGCYVFVELGASLTHTRKTQKAPKVFNITRFHNQLWVRFISPEASKLWWG
ncbi:hypothetical protein VNO78_08287 [Psophocarpus tetragonolobus]|uniref:Uncharacterized protein n=1 Tax=Psophocarpus tetragonolobus TaxID=3891 RepID=A0AAN9XSV2_PSOTE